MPDSDLTADAILQATNRARLVYEEWARDREISGPVRKILVAEGDSWFDYRFWLDVLDALEGDGWDVRSVAHFGHDLDDMAYNECQWRPLLKELAQVKISGGSPTAILISAGGNDLAGPEFKSLINHRNDVAKGVNKVVLMEMMEGRIQRAYASLIARVTESSFQFFGHKVPIVVHGYSYPVPDGRGVELPWPFKLGPWLQPTFDHKGYEGDIAATKSMMVIIIDAFNSMLAELVAREEFKSHVHFVDLRRILRSDGRYQEDWANEMHPTRAGFKKVSTEIDRQLRLLAPTKP